MEPLRTTSELAGCEININGTTFTYPEFVSSEASKIGLDQYTRDVTERCTATVYSTESIHKPTIVYTATIHATKTIYSLTTVHKSAYSSPCPFKLETATNHAVLLNIVLPATEAVLSLLVLLLIVVTTGWIWTCRIIRSKNNLQRY